MDSPKPPIPVKNEPRPEPNERPALPTDVALASLMNNPNKITPTIGIANLVIDTKI